MVCEEGERSQVISCILCMYYVMMRSKRRRSESDNNDENIYIYI